MNAFKAKANHRFSCIQTCIHSKIINLKMVSWSSDTRSSKNYPPIQKFWYVDPLQKQGHICFWHLIPCKSKVFAIHYFLTPCRSKVITFIYFLDSLHKQSHHYLNLLICWPTTEARAHLFLALDPLQKQGLGHSLFFNSLQKQSNNHSSRSSAEARSPHFFSTRHKARTKSVSLSWLNFYFDNTNFSQTFHIIM